MTGPDQRSPYQHYVYAYPHKTAYRPLSPRPSLREVWATEDRSALFLYLHVPFCEMRCGFCNLFTRTGAPEELTGAYLDALERQAACVADALGDAAFATAAFGGGTPTYLTALELERLCDIGARLATLGAIPLGVETSPATATTDRLTLLRERGTTRVSIGVQSFLDSEARAAGRPQKRAEVESALERIRAVGFETLNIDLIYGIDGQTPATWLHSLDASLAWRPEEMYLYPLYVRPLTGLARRDLDWDDQRMDLYSLGRDHLLSNGYEQVSMRMFRLPSGDGVSGTEYCCQTDGMVGLGCGARSYTSTLHYSFEYAVGTRHVRAIIDDYVHETDFDSARVGFVLDDDERPRRHLIQSLLQAEGLDRAAYRERFHTDVTADFDLTVFSERGWLEQGPTTIRLTPEGLAHSDAIGPALFSPQVRALMTGYTLR
ncbi:STM4012 family radical SAM protein [Frankia sp. CNm7]|uniref:Heme chaperone HemW n=1 Tax=Frankia nepalensis TaxID=1836974 RepID=A0A937RJQ9_9ACTN|nr:STM4012 family radical SAM protein [Frankia nepalensis]MBL7496297.1 STM4012 family radical SAM protein [Frankia nepalensis]MBL7508506.1 STM4012 family radical SAM protein [Frankia nepalensis]MBL7520239.1 STM4012 family radical SAM protein [Frankia nepalensis]MBL7627638.1 STM4012 family radical SAM protein [Frankia nepalensis]